MKKCCICFLLLLPVILRAQIITTIAGTGASTFSGEDVPAISAGVPNPGSGSFDKIGNYYFVDGVNSHRIRKISPSGIISTIAGNGMGGYAGDNGPASVARLNGPTGIALDTFGNLFISDGQNHRIRRVDALTNIITTIAGNGIGGYNGDGLQATAAQIWGPADICVDKFGNIYIADGVNSRVRKINLAGIISTYAGSGISGYSGDYGLATNAQLALPSGVALDDTGNLYIADNGSISNCIRKVNVSGIITTIAGNGIATYAGDGIAATSAQISPNKIKLDHSSNLFVSDRFNNRVYKVEALTGVLHNIVGTGLIGDGGDGSPATAASLNYPSGVALDACGNLYIPTVGSVSVPGSGRRIRKVTFTPHTTASAAISSVSTAPIGTVVTVTATVSGAGSAYSIKWFNRGSLFATTTVPTVIYTKAAGTDTITARIVPAMAACYDSSTSAQHIVAVGTNGINDITAGDIGVISIYPNPAHSSLIVSADAVASSIVITDLAGRVLLTKANNTTTAMLDISQLAAGVYFVKVNGIYVQKLIKE